MQVILLQDLYKHGVAGEVVKVADGFARNYLIPNKMAVRASDSALRQTENIRKNAEARRAQYENRLNELGRQIDGVELVFGRLAAVTGKLFGSVTTQEIADALMEETGVDINRRRISQRGIREIGLHEVPVRLGTDVSPVLQVIVVRQEDLADFLAAREAGEEVEIEEASASAEDAEVEAGDIETEVIPDSAVEEAVELADSVEEVVEDDEA